MRAAAALATAAGLLGVWFGFGLWMIYQGPVLGPACTGNCYDVDRVGPPVRFVLATVGLIAAFVGVVTCWIRPSWGAGLLAGAAVAILASSLGSYTWGGGLHDLHFLSGGSMGLAAIAAHVRGRAAGRLQE